MYFRRNSSFLFIVSVLFTTLAFSFANASAPVWLPFLETLTSHCLRVLLFFGLCFVITAPFGQALVVLLGE